MRKVGVVEGMLPGVSILLAVVLAGAGVEDRDTLRPSGQSEIVFEDVTEKAGLALEIPPSGDKPYILESTGGGVAFLDYDRDGWLDIYLVNVQTVEEFQQGRIYSPRLYRNNRDGTFGDVTEAAGLTFRGWGMGVSVADYNNDGFPDLYLTNFGPNVLYRNNGDGTFTDVTEAAGVGDARYSTSSGWADFDGNGNLDLFVANYLDIRLDRLPRFGEGEYCLYKGLAVQCGPRGLKGAGNTLYRNNGDGTFMDVSREAGVADELAYYGLGVVWSDLDGDGHVDLYVANDTNPNYLYWNRGDGTFLEGALLAGAGVDPNGKGQAGMGVAVGDYDNDGLFDLTVTNFSEETNALYRNQGSRFFEESTYPAGVGEPSYPLVGWGTFFADLDNEGWKDLFAVNGHVYPQVDRIPGMSYRQPCLLLRNRGDGTFEEITTRAGEALGVLRSSRGAALGDFDNDGLLDILLMDIDRGPVLLRNKTRNPGNYIRVKAPVGSRITVTAGGSDRVDEIRASGSYLSASEQVAHFGVGEARFVDEIVIRFPDGRQERRGRTQVNQTIVERPPVIR